MTGARPRLEPVGELLLELAAGLILRPLLGGGGSMPRRRAPVRGRGEPAARGRDGARTWGRRDARWPAVPAAWRARGGAGGLGGAGGAGASATASVTRVPGTIGTGMPSTASRISWAAWSRASRTSWDASARASRTSALASSTARCASWRASATARRASAMESSPSSSSRSWRSTGLGGWTRMRADRSAAARARRWRTSA